MPTDVEAGTARLSPALRTGASPSWSRQSPCMTVCWSRLHTPKRLFRFRPKVLRSGHRARGAGYFHGRTCGEHCEHGEAADPASKGLHNGATEAVQPRRPLLLREHRALRTSSVLKINQTSTHRRRGTGPGNAPYRQRLPSVRLIPLSINRVRNKREAFNPPRIRPPPARAVRGAPHRTAARCRDRKIPY